MITQEGDVLRGRLRMGEMVGWGQGSYALRRRADIRERGMSATRRIRSWAISAVVVAFLLSIARTSAIAEPAAGHACGHGRFTARTEGSADRREIQPRAKGALAMGRQARLQVRAGIVRGRRWSRFQHMLMLLLSRAHACRFS